MTTAVYISAIALAFVVIVVARFAGTWLVWTHGREWFRGYCAENAGRSRSDAPRRYGRLGRKAWAAGWDCSHEITPNDAVTATSEDARKTLDLSTVDVSEMRKGGFRVFHAPEGEKWKPRD